MSLAVEQDLNRRLRQLERANLLVRQGVIVDNSPLTVSIAGGAEVKAVALTAAGASIGDRVNILAWPGNILILGPATDSPVVPTAGGGAPTAHASSHASAGSDPVTLAQSQVTDLPADLALKATLASPEFTGTPLITTTPTPGDNSHKIPDTAFVEARAVAAQAGFTIKAPVDILKDTPLPAHTRSGNVLTASGNGAIFGGLYSVFVTGEGGGTHLENGIYMVTDTGSGSTPWVLTRRSDADVDGEVKTGMFVLVVDVGRSFILATADPITLNTTALTFTEFLTKDPRISTYGATLVDDADASTALSTLGVSTYAKTILDDADAATARATLGTDRKALAFRAHVTTGGVTNGSVVIFDSEADPSGDPDSTYNTTNGRWTPGVAGYSDISAGARPNAALTADNYWQVAITRNGTEVAAGSLSFQRGSVAMASVVSCVLKHDADDYFEIVVYHNKGSSQTLGTGSQTYFSGTLARAD